MDDCDFPMDNGNMDDSLPEDDRIAVALSNLALHATGGSDPGNLEERLVGYRSIETIKPFFLDEGIGWGEILEEDIQRVLAGLDPRYFMSMSQWRDLYLSRRNMTVPKTDGEVPVYSPEEVARLTMQTIEQRQEEIRKYGVSLAYPTHGYACLAERQYFYGTQEWRDAAKAMRFIAHYRCERCKTRGEQLQVHHTSPIISAYHYNFELNFASWKLRVLCRSCHHEYHRNAVADPLSYSYFVAHTDWEHKEYIKRLESLDKLHDKLGICEFCNNQIAHGYPNRGTM